MWMGALGRLQGICTCGRPTWRVPWGHPQISPKCPCDHTLSVQTSINFLSLSLWVCISACLSQIIVHFHKKVYVLMAVYQYLVKAVVATLSSDKHILLNWKLYLFFCQFIFQRKLQDCKLYEWDFVFWPWYLYLPHKTNCNNWVSDGISVPNPPCLPLSPAYLPTGC